MDLYYPKAKVVDPPLETQDKYLAGFPSGAVVHYTAGNHGLSALSWARNEGYTYLLIDTDGSVHQGFPLDEWGFHAGVSSWPPLGRGGVSSKLVGIEMACAGRVEADGNGNFKTCWGAPLSAAEVRLVPQQRDNQVPGAYHRYTDEQEQALIDLLIWMKLNAPTIFDLNLVLGHDEVSPGRKQDPGGSLSFTMPALRSYLNNRLKQVSGQGVTST